MRSLVAVPLSLAFCVTACGPPAGEESGEVTDAAPEVEVAAEPEGHPTPTGPLATPDWFAVDHDARTVQIGVTAGSVPDNDYWNFNETTEGGLTLAVPEGYTLTIDLVNSDPNWGHGVGISPEIEDFLALPPSEPAFDGAITEDATSMITSTMPGESESIEFVADAAGHYELVCHIPGHMAKGMWLHFVVTEDGQAGVWGM